MSRIAFLQSLLTSVFARQQAGLLGDDDRTLSELCEALLSERGEMSGNRLAATILSHFAAAEADEREGFFALLANALDIDADAAVDAAIRYRDEQSVDNLAALLHATEPRRQELLRRLNQVPGATGSLVSMREALRKRFADHPEFRRVDLDFMHLFASWFNRGFLVLREIDWHTPANILEKIIAYEAVHAIDSWDALRTRLQPVDRKCFAFFHPAMLDEPLIFLEVALVNRLPTSIQDLLASERKSVVETKATTALFYSISNCQPGLAGVSFGSSLIKQVVQELALQQPGLTSFRTLSPLPDFIRWARSIASDQHPSRRHAVHTALAVSMGKSVGDTEQLPALVVDYLVNQRRDDRQPIDPVARFHLGNGASLASILPDADRSEKGLQQSAGFMVSYLYDLARVDANHEAYAQRRDIVMSDEVRALSTASKWVSTTAGS